MSRKIFTHLIFIKEILVFVDSRVSLLWLEHVLSAYNNDKGKHIMLE
jgi:hypothetical protein